MPAYATGERCGGEEDQQGQDIEDGQYRFLQKEILQREEDITSMTTKTEAMMEQLRATGGGPMPGASATANLELESVYNAAAFSSLLNTQTLGARWLPS